MSLPAVTAALSAVLVSGLALQNQILVLGTQTHPKAGI